jgi:hypothetical protein
MEIQILKTIPGDENFHFFEEVLPAIYSPEEMQLKLNENINPDFFHSAFIALQDNKALGRCCLYNNREMNYLGKPTACIGNYECTKSARISEVLFKSAYTEAKRMGAEYILGPMNGSTWDTYRLGKYGKSPNFFLEPFYPNYYHQHFFNAGFEPIARFVSNTDRTGNLLDERIERVAKEFSERGITFRNIDLENYEA